MAGGRILGAAAVGLAADFRPAQGRAGTEGHELRPDAGDRAALGAGGAGAAGPGRASPVAEAMRAKLDSVAGRAIYAGRKTLPEPVFGQIKEGRGFRRFSFRGVAKVRAEWAVICLTHNLLKLFGARWALQPA